ncbi:hypothetical protein [Asaia platycodi]|uniref:hypothetical protein n=1 Tax=Asaia platycodi TaxID=610243 RepID=UPI0004705A3F|nr:hypothetical protein [Asaia platycodi]
MPNSLEIVKGTIAPLSTLVLGLLTYNVSRYQKNIQKEKIISDLFTRRIEVYDAFLDAICLIAFNYNASIHDYDELKIVQKQYNYARFLFEEEAYSKLTSIKCDIFEYHFKAQFQNKAIGPSVNETEHDMQVKKKTS